MQYINSIDPEPLRHSARRFQIFFHAGFLASVMLAVLILIGLLTNPVWIGGALSKAAGHPLNAPKLWQSSALVGIVVVMLGIYAAVFHTAAALCRMLVQSSPGQAANAARRLSNWLWALLGLSICCNTLGVLVATAHANPGERVLSIALGSPQIAFAIAALISAFLAHAFVLGAALWQDHREIV